MKAGDKVQFTYPNFSCEGIEGEGYPDYALHSGAIVTIIREIPNAFQDADGNDARGFLVRADDNWQGIVWPGELRQPKHGR